jgi:tetratricopeptide (TPR) repeat protein
VPNAEVTGISTTKSKPKASGATFERKSSTQPTRNWGGKENQVQRANSVSIDTFFRRLDEAETLEDRGALGKAEARYNQLIDLCKRKLGVERHETAIAYNHLALLHLRGGKLELAKPLFEKSLRILIRTLGIDHRHTSTVRANLADLLHEKARGPS